MGRTSWKLWMSGLNLYHSPPSMKRITSCFGFLYSSASCPAALCVLKAFHLFQAKSKPQNLQSKLLLRQRSRPRPAPLSTLYQMGSQDEPICITPLFGESIRSESNQ